MSVQRAWLIWSPLLRPLQNNFIPVNAAETCIKLRPPPRAGFHTSRFRSRPEVVQRYGTANEPPPHLVDGKPADKKGGQSQAALPKPDSKSPKEKKAATPPDQQQQKTSEAKAKEASTKPPETVINLEAPFQSNSDVASKEEVVLQRTRAERQSTKSPKPDQYSSSQNALNEILQMEQPTGDGEKPPHLQAPPYVHHFDTYTLVRALQEDSSFTEKQAISLMKAVRVILADNMDLARDGIVGKGDAEMAAYLFQAACSELRTEIRNNRSGLTERMRAERTDLQHRVDILSQRIGTDTSTLKDELKGMFDDRKMSVRMERRDIENRIQELNYKITASLNSEMRSEVEGLRWVLVRRTAMAIVIVAVTALFLLRMNTASIKRQEEAEERLKRPEGGRGGGGGVGGGGGGGGGGAAGMDGRGLAAIGVAEAIASSSDLIKGLEGAGDPALTSVG